MDDPLIALTGAIGERLPAETKAGRGARSGGQPSRCSNRSPASGWRDNGLLPAIRLALAMETREPEGREASPSAGVIDSRCVETTESGGICGFDAGRRVMGRKRHILVDTIGLLFGLVVHAADIQDRDGVPAVLKSIGHACPWLRHIFADGGYAGPKLRGALDRMGDWTLQIVKRSDTAKGFEILPRRWGANAPSPGSGDAGGWPGIGRNPSPPRRPGSTLPISASPPDASEGSAIVKWMPSQALRACLKTRTGRSAGAFCAPVRRSCRPISPIVSPMTSCRDPGNPSAALRRRSSKRSLTRPSVPGPGQAASSLPSASPAWPWSVLCQWKGA